MENIVLHEDFLLVKYRHNAELNYGLKKHHELALTECKEQYQTDHPWAQNRGLLLKFLC